MSTALTIGLDESRSNIWTVECPCCGLSVPIPDDLRHDQMERRFLDEN